MKKAREVIEIEAQALRDLAKKIDGNFSNAVDIIIHCKGRVIVTGMGDARNSINVLSSDVVVVCGMNPGTACEVALAIKAKKPLIFINVNTKAQTFFQSLTRQSILICSAPDEVIAAAQKIVGKQFKLAHKKS